MKYRKLDHEDDYTFGRRDGFYTNVEAVAQAVKTRLLLLKGEWWENILDGTPLLEEAAGQFFPLAERAARVDLMISERILGTMGVTEITAFESGINPQTRTYYAQVSVSTIYGDVFQIGVTTAGGNSVIAVL